MRDHVSDRVVFCHDRGRVHLDSSRRQRVAADQPKRCAMGNILFDLRHDYYRRHRDADHPTAGAGGKHDAFGAVVELDRRPARRAHRSLRRGPHSAVGSSRVHRRHRRRTIGFLHFARSFRVDESAAATSYLEPRSRRPSGVCRCLAGNATIVRLRPVCRNFSSRLRYGMKRFLRPQN